MCSCNLIHPSVIIVFAFPLLFFLKIPATCLDVSCYVYPSRYTGYQVRNIFANERFLVAGWADRLWGIRCNDEKRERRSREENYEGEFQPGWSTRSNSTKWQVWVIISHGLWSLSANLSYAASLWLHFWILITLVVGLVVFNKCTSFQWHVKQYT